MRKNVSIYSHEYRDQNMGGKQSAEQFFRKHTKSVNEKCCERNRRKKLRKIFFLYSHEYRAEKMGGKTRETIFPETHE